MTNNCTIVLLLERRALLENCSGCKDRENRENRERECEREYFFSSQACLFFSLVKMESLLSCTHGAVAVAAAAATALKGFPSMPFLLLFGGIGGGRGRGHTSRGQERTKEREKKQGYRKAVCKACWLVFFVCDSSSCCYCLSFLLTPWPAQLKCSALLKQLWPVASLAIKEKTED